MWEKFLLYFNLESFMMKKQTLNTADLVSKVLEDTLTNEDAKLICHLIKESDVKALGLMLAKLGANMVSKHDNEDEHLRSLLYPKHSRDTETYLGDTTHEVAKDYGHNFNISYSDEAVYNKVAESNDNAWIALGRMLQQFKVYAWLKTSKKKLNDSIKCFILMLLYYCFQVGFDGSVTNFWVNDNLMETMIRNVRDFVHIFSSIFEHAHYGLNYTKFLKLPDVENENSEFKNISTCKWRDFHENGINMLKRFSKMHCEDIKAYYTAHVNKTWWYFHLKDLINHLLFGKTITGKKKKYGIHLTNVRK